MLKALASCMLYEFTSRFADFRKCETEFNLFSQLYDMAPEGSSDYYQMELIYLQYDMDFRTYDTNDLVIFYKNYVFGKHPNLEQHVRKLTSLFGSNVVSSYQERNLLKTDDQ